MTPLCYAKVAARHRPNATHLNTAQNRHHRLLRLGQCPFSLIYGAQPRTAWFASIVKLLAMLRTFGDIRCLRPKTLTENRSTLALCDRPPCQPRKMDLQSRPTPHLLVTNPLPTPAGCLLPIVVPSLQCVVVQPPTRKADHHSSGCKSSDPSQYQMLLSVFYKRDRSNSWRVHHMPLWTLKLPRQSWTKHFDVN